jgi:ribose transport system substrate-binding protein
MTYTIGFANLDESMPSVVYRRSTLEMAAAEHPDLQLIIRDNQLDDERALANVQEFADQSVDLAIIFHINERLGPAFNKILMPRRIPIIAVDIPIPMAFYFGANNQESGLLAGDALGRYIRQQWGGQVDKLLVLTESRVTTVLRDRVNYSVAGLQNQVVVQGTDILYLDSGHSRETAANRTAEVLNRWLPYEHIAIIGINDDTALGALDAARLLGREHHVAIVGHGADEQARTEMRRPGSAFVASADYHFEQYGPRLIDIALRIRRREHIPQMHYIQHSCVTAFG